MLVVELEATEIVTYQTNFILEERIKAFEELQRKNIHNRYFTDNETTQSQCNHQMNSSLNSCCRSYCPTIQPTCCNHKTNTHGCPKNLHINSIQHKIEVDARDIQDIKSELIVLNSANKNTSCKDTNTTPMSSITPPGTNNADVSNNGTPSPALSTVESTRPTAGTGTEGVPMMIDSDASSDDDEDQTVMPLN